jgi:hypothetical protein
MTLPFLQLLVFEALKVEKLDDWVADPQAPAQCILEHRSEKPQIKVPQNVSEYAFSKASKEVGLITNLSWSSGEGC